MKSQLLRLVWVSKSIENDQKLQQYWLDTIDDYLRGTHDYDESGAIDQDVPTLKAEEEEDTKDHSFSNY